MAIIHFRCKERRRTVRVMLTVPLRVSGKTEIGEKFSVRAMSHSVSLHGASVELEKGVVLGEILQLENEITREKVEGKRRCTRRGRDGRRYVSIEFTDREPNFWHMAFPIPGAGPMRRQLSSKVSSL